MSTTLYEAHPAMFRNNPLGFVLALLLVVVGVGLLILGWWYLQTRAARIAVTESDVLLETGILSKDRRECRIEDVRTVHVSQSFFDRLLDVGKVQIYTAGDDPEIEIKGIRNPDRVREIIKARDN